jgi:hypothetical protein
VLVNPSWCHAHHQASWFAVPSLFDEEDASKHLGLELKDRREMVDIVLIMSKTKEEK